MRLVDSHRHVVNPRIKNGARDAVGKFLDEVAVLSFDHCHNLLSDLGVVDGVGYVVGSNRLAHIEIQGDINAEVLRLGVLRLQHPVGSHGANPGESNGASHYCPFTSLSLAATAIADAVAATLCTRTAHVVVPLKNALTTAVAKSRSSYGRSSATVPARKRLRE